MFLWILRLIGEKSISEVGGESFFDPQAGNRGFVIVFVFESVFAFALRLRCMRACARASERRRRRRRLQLLLLHACSVQPHEIAPRSYSNGRADQDTSAWIRGPCVGSY